MDAGRGTAPMTARFAALLAGLALIAAAAPAFAHDLAFAATLRGDKAPTITGSKATGRARIVVHTHTQTVDIALDVAGLGVEDLSRGLRASPMGPIHLHIYGGTDHSPAADAALVFPVPYGPAYVTSATGFAVRMTGLDYAKGAALVNTQTGFKDFVAALSTGKVVLNVHTNRFGDGEISGDVTPAG